jgi:SAM-dependent methyltransferase
VARTVPSHGCTSTDGIIDEERVVTAPQISTATPGFEQTIEICRTRLDLGRDAFVLDVPCGRGEALVRLAASHDIRGVGVDLGEVVEAAAAKGTSRISFIEADARSLQFPDGHFDVVLCIGGPTCISPAIAQRQAPSAEELQENLDELMRVLRPGGRIVTSDMYVATTEPRTGRYTVGQWVEMLEAPGADVELFEALPVGAWDEYLEPRLEVARWHRQQAGDDPRALANLDAHEAELLALRPEGRLAYYGTFVARRRGDRAT